ncbi:MAG: hypothetical protein J7J73_00335 [Deltaproteobacteria bacterium]|nr:hypothetical protein [Deltaproteobacteria bacterium]
MSKKITFILVIILLLVVGFVVANHVATTKAKEQVNNYIYKNKLEKTVSYKEVKASVFPKHISIKNVSISTEEKIIYINEILVRSLDTKNDIPLYGDIEIKHISSPGSEEFTETEKKLKELGYDSLKLNLRMKFNNNKATKTQNIDYVTTIENAFKAGFVFKLGNIDFKKMKEMQNYFKEKFNDVSPDELLSFSQNFMSVSISYCEFYFKNEGLIDKIMEKEARDKGISEEKIKENMCKILDMQITSAKMHKQREFFEAIKKFIKKPRKISVKISPSKPVEIQEIIQCIKSKNTNKLLNKLNLSIDA